MYPVLILRFLSAAFLILLVLFSIISPLKSITVASQNLTGTIIIVFTSNVFEYEGKKLYGFIRVSLDSPNSTREYIITTRDVEKSRVHRFYFDKQVNEWDKYFKANHSKLLKIGIFTIPTISISFSLFDDEGYEYLGSIDYSSVTHFLNLGLPLPEAVKRAALDPMAMFKRRSIVIVIDPRRIELAKTDIDTMLWKVVGERSQSLSENVMDKIETLGSCPDFTEIIWNQLYDARYSPPPKWKDNITIVISGKSEDESENFVWWSFAVYNSKSYYRNAYYYGSSDPQNALYSVTQILGDEGFYLMEEFFKMQAEKHGYSVVKAEWREKIPRGTILGWYSTYVVGFEFSERAKSEADIGFTLMISDMEVSYNRQGISFAGVLTDVKQEIKVDSTMMDIYFTRKNYVDGYDRMYISHYSTYKFHGTGIYLKYSVRKEYVNDCLYWVITPIPILFTPKYSKLYDYLKSGIPGWLRAGDPMPYDYDKIAWKIDRGNVERPIKKLTGKDLRRDRYVVIDELKRSDINVNAGAAFENLFYDLSIAVVSAIIGYANPPLGLLIGFLSLLDFVEFTASTSIRNLQLTVWPEPGYTPPDDLEIYAMKYTISSRSNEVFDRKGYFPLLVRYHIYVQFYEERDPGEEPYYSYES